MKLVAMSVLFISVLVLGACGSEQESRPCAECGDQAAQLNDSVVSPSPSKPAPANVGSANLTLQAEDEESQIPVIPGQAPASVSQ